MQRDQRPQVSRDATCKLIIVQPQVLQRHQVSQFGRNAARKLIVAQRESCNFCIVPRLAGMPPASRFVDRSR